MSDTIELEMDAPALSRPTPGLSPLAHVLIAIRMARTVDECARAIAPARAWPDGPDKDRVRSELDMAKVRLARAAQPTPSPAPSEPVLISTRGAQALARIDAAIALADIADPTEETAPVAPPAGPDVTSLHAQWADIWGSVAQAVMFRRPQANGRAPAPGAGVGRVRNPGEGVGGPVRTVAQEGEDRATMRQLVTRRSVVIGASTDGSGVLLGWSGSGEHTRIGICNALAAAGHPVSWAPNPHSAHAHAAAALATLNAGGRIIRAERGVRTHQGIRRHVARWTVGMPSHGTVGEQMGPIVLSVALTQHGELDMDGDQKLAAIVRAEYTRRVGAEVYPAGDVTYWLRGVLIARFYAVRLGGGWYVPHEFAPGAEALCNALSAQGWGNDWVLPALPVATTDQLRAGLTRGLISEAESILAEFETQRTAAKRDRVGGDIGPRAAATLLGRLKEVHDRARDYGTMLGAAFVAPIRARLGDALAVIEAQCDDTAQRFAMMDLA